jgi:hypothetical protein
MGAAVVAATACSTYRPMLESQESGGDVRVSFRSPRTIAVRRTSGEELSFAATEVTGHVNRTSGDTLYMRVRGIRGPTGDVKGVPMNGPATIVRDQDTVVQRQVYSNDRTLGLLLGGATVLFLIFLAWQAAHEEVVY